MDRLAGLVGQWLRLQGLSDVIANALLSTDYAGQPSKLPHMPKSVMVIDHTPIVKPQRQARHLTALIEAGIKLNQP